jgi:hypothetical protein
MTDVWDIVNKKIVKVHKADGLIIELENGLRFFIEPCHYAIGQDEINKANLRGYEQLKEKSP